LNYTHLRCQSKGFWPQREVLSKADLFVQAFGFDGLFQIKILASFLITPVGYRAACFVRLFGRVLCFGFLKVKKFKALNSLFNYVQKMFCLN